MYFLKDVNAVPIVGAVSVDKYVVIAVTAGNDRRQGGIGKGEFDTFEEAQHRRTEINELGNVHIKMPDGSYWPEDYNDV